MRFLVAESQSTSHLSRYTGCLATQGCTLDILCSIQSRRSLSSKTFSIRIYEAITLVDAGIVCLYVVTALVVDISTAGLAYLSRAAPGITYICTQFRSLICAIRH
jgi:hypothetical protein